MEETKKMTKGQLERRIINSLVFVEKTSDYQAVYFADRGLKLEVTHEYCVIGTVANKHVYHAISPSGQQSRPYVYTKSVIEIANANKDLVVKGDSGLSFEKLMEELNKKEDKTGYNILWYYDIWITSLHDKTYSISEDEGLSFMALVDYVLSVSKNAFMLQERKEDLTNKQYIDFLIEKLKEIQIDERVIMKKLTDEERVSQELEAIAEERKEQM